jgi:hypothetical protein
MKFLKRRFSTTLEGTALFLLIVGFSSRLLAQQDYEIHLNRPLKPGDQFKVVARGRNSQEIRMSQGHEPSHEKKDARESCNTADVRNWQTENEKKWDPVPTFHIFLTRG